MANQMLTKKISKVVKENENITTYELDCSIDAMPGQFIMVWLPGIGERPMSIADNSPLTITVAHVGIATNAMRALKKGEQLSFRGPFGKGFTLPKKGEKVLVIGGGIGIAGVHLLAKQARQLGVDTTILLGLKDAAALFYKSKLEKIANKLIITTSDGSLGLKGKMEGIKAAGKVDRTYICGPEKMMAEVVKDAAAKGVQCEASLERYMKCGMGVCGSCMIGKFRVCADGPVFSGEVLLKEPEFGKIRRDSSGQEVQL